MTPSNMHYNITCAFMLSVFLENYYRHIGVRKGCRGKSGRESQIQSTILERCKSELQEPPYQVILAKNATNAFHRKLIYIIGSNFILHTLM